MKIYLVTRTMPENKNKKTLARFTLFCRQHPEMSFWQALVEYVKENVDSDAEMLLVQVSRSRHLLDTLYFE